MSTREQVLELVCQGKTNKQIAMELGKAEGTIKMHLTGLYAQHGVKTRTQLALHVAKNPTILKDKTFVHQVNCPVVENYSKDKQP